MQVKFSTDSSLFPEMELYGAAGEDKTNVDLATGVVKLVTEVVVELGA